MIFKVKRVSCGKVTNVENPNASTLNRGIVPHESLCDLSSRFTNCPIVNSESMS